MTWQLLAAAGEDGWWRRISSFSSADFFNGRFVFAYFYNRSIVGTAVTPLVDSSHNFRDGVDCKYIL